MLCIGYIWYVREVVGSRPGREYGEIYIILPGYTGIGIISPDI